MMYYISKIREYIILNVKLLKEFGLKIAIYDFLKKFIFRKNIGLGKKIYYKKYETIKSRLKKDYKYLIDYYKTNINSEIKNNIKNDAPIWIFWWQGINENTPENVKLCIKSIKKYCGNHTVNILSQENINDFISLDKMYYEKLKKGIFSLTHFSDIIRVELLAKYGGIWMDATIILNKNLEDYIYNYSFYTIKHGQFSDFHVCKGLWSGFFLASSENNYLFSFLKDFFQEYWKKENVLCCYLLIDCFISIAYEEIYQIKQMIDKVPYNNSDIFYLDINGNNLYDGDIDNINAYIHKIHYKKRFKCYNKNDKITNFGHITEKLK